MAQAPTRRQASSIRVHLNGRAALPAALRLRRRLSGGLIGGPRLLLRLAGRHRKRADCQGRSKQDIHEAPPRR